MRCNQKEKQWCKIINLLWLLLSNFEIQSNISLKFISNEFQQDIEVVYKLHWELYFWTYALALKWDIVKYCMHIQSLAHNIFHSLGFLYCISLITFQKNI